MEFDEQKFAELMLYVADRSVDDPDFGATKLNKILFFSDFSAYEKFGKSITGAIYQKLDHGPAPRHLLPIQAELIRKSHACITPVSRYSFTQKRFTALRESDLNVFSNEEIALVSQIIDTLQGKNAVQVSEMSHRFDGWKLADDGEEIPYFTVFLQPPQLTAEAVEKGMTVAKELDLVA
jgi:hypothetical protein